MKVELFEPLDRPGEMPSEAAGPPLNRWQDLRGKLVRNRAAMAGLIAVLAVAAAGALGPSLSPYAYDQQDLANNLKPPSLAHPFGTDELGRDLLTRVLFGARISLSVGTLASLTAFGIGVPYGAVSGYFGGRIDEGMMRFVEVLRGIPFQLYIILLMVVLGPGLRNVFLAIGLVYWLDMARIVRGETLRLKEREFVLAARAMGAGPLRIIFRHLVPNASGPIIVTMTMMIPEAIFAEAFLSFIGLGVSAPMASWGALASSGYSSIRTAPWALLFPAAAITLTILAFNFLADGLRDALDPWSS